MSGAAYKIVPVGPRSGASGGDREVIKSPERTLTSVGERGGWPAVSGCCGTAPLPAGTSGVEGSFGRGCSRLDI